jgi:nitroimidazol reductase NimA-like FMN-containing flavoprotein (pyridoxamine 5'-phosphate oxidase superfamily)
MAANGTLAQDLTLGSLAWARGPRIRNLSEREMGFVLARNCVGRIAYQGDGRVELVPVHYAYVEGGVVGRTSLGAKYLSWLTRDQVVMGVEEIHGLFDWRSVLVRGSVRILSPRGSAQERAAYAEAVSAIRSIIPGAFTERDPTPYRSAVFAIAPLEMTGRTALVR